MHICPLFMSQIHQQNRNIRRGNAPKGRLMNVVGEAVDGMRPLSKEGAFPIHREPPKFDELSRCV